jgi:tRNA(Ile2) C34 agmatinyltransferase TiaS
MVNLHPVCKKCNSLMIIIGEENGYRIWDCPNKCSLNEEELETF